MDSLIKFKSKNDKIIESLLLLSHLGKFSRYQVVKFLYLADREHLRRYGRPITFDNYYAMENGPVASEAYDLLRNADSVANLPFDSVLDGKHYYLVNPKREVNMDAMSRSDVKILREMVDLYKDHSFDELYQLTHSHAAYKNAWENRTSGSKSNRMSFDDFFEGMEDKDTIIEELAFAARGM